MRAKIKRTWKAWSRVKRIEVILSCLAILISIVALVQTGISLRRDIEQRIQEAERYNEQVTSQAVQATLSAEVATNDAQHLEETHLLEVAQSTFEVQVQATESALRTTVEAQVERQTQLQETQVAIEQYQQYLAATQVANDERLSNLYQQLAFPFMKVIPFSFETRLTSAQSVQGGEAVSVTGTIDLILANDGGGQSGLIAISVTQSITNLTDAVLDIETFSLDDETFDQLPINLEGQSAHRITLGFNGQLSQDSTGTLDWWVRQNLLRSQPQGVSYFYGLTENQSGQLWSKNILATEPKLILQFSNTDPLTVAIDLFVLNDLPIVTIQPVPPSPFQITDADETGEIVVRVINDEGLSYMAVDGEGDSSEPIRSDQPYTFPVGSYQLLHLINDQQEFLLGTFDVFPREATVASFIFPNTPTQTPTLTLPSPTSTQVTAETVVVPPPPPPPPSSSIPLFAIFVFASLPVALIVIVNNISVSHLKLVVWSRNQKRREVYLRFSILRRKHKFVVQPGFGKFLVTKLKLGSGQTFYSIVLIDENSREKQSHQVIFEIDSESGHTPELLLGNVTVEVEEL